MEVKPYLEYLDKEMTIMGILSAASVAAPAGILNAALSKDAQALLWIPEHFFIVMGSVLCVIAAMMFYKERSDLAWYYGQICLTEAIAEKKALGAELREWLRDADSWEHGGPYCLGFTFLVAGISEYLCAFFFLLTPSHWPWLATHLSTLKTLAFLACPILACVVAPVQWYVRTRYKFSDDAWTDFKSDLLKRLQSGRRLPHEEVYTRLIPSRIHGVGVAAIKDIPQGTYAFEPDDDALVSISAKATKSLPPEVRRLYEDFCVLKGDKYQCPSSFNKLNPAWFLNNSKDPNIEDADGNVRSNLYMALLGDVGDGKTVCMKAALASIPLPGENTLIKRSPGSNSGLLNRLDENEPKPFLLALNELKTVLDACAIQGSRLPQMLCTMWEEDEYGNSVKRGVSDGYGKLSIIGGLAVGDSADFGRLFGTSSVTGMADRFLLGYCTAMVAYKPIRITPTVINVKPVHIAEWVWDVKNEWVGVHRERRRMSEQALRVALVTAAVNGDTEITSPCLEAAFRFCEWQLRLRQKFKPGIAETKEAECYEAVYNALKEAYERQHKSRQMPKDADRITDPDFDREDRWQLLNFRGIVNSKSYYRRYAGLIDRVRKSMADNGVIEEYREPEEEDERGREKNKGKKSKTPFVILRARVL